MSTSPKRGRRRWLSVAFGLVLVSMVSWWFWPRGDARFLGKWQIVGQSRLVSNIYQMRSIGLGTFIQTACGVSRTFPMRWWARGDLVFFEIWSGDLEDDLRTLMDRLTGKLPRAPFRILEVGSAVARLQRSNGDISTWERISE